MIKDCHVGVKGIICNQGRCLLLKRITRDETHWDMPGGRIDGDETLHETLVRELHEELPSIQNFSIGPLVGAYRLPLDILDGKGLVILFYAVDVETFDVILSDEHIGYSWVSLEDVTQGEVEKIPLLPELKEILIRVLKT